MYLRSCISMFFQYTMTYILSLENVNCVLYDVTFTRPIIVRLFNNSNGPEIREIVLERTERDTKTF